MTAERIELAPEGAVADGSPDAGSPLAAGPDDGGPAAAGDDAPAGSLWRNRDFVTFWFGETLSLYGTQITVLALPLTAVYTFGAGPQLLGWLRFAQLIPYLLFALLFGVWVDRGRRRPVMLGANVARMLLIGSVPVLAVTGYLSLYLLLLIGFAVGVASVLFDVSWMSYIPTLVRDKRYLVEANSKLSMTSSSADAAGPGVAGALIGVLTAPIALAFDAFSYLLSVTSLLIIRAPEPRPTSAGPKRRLIPELREGLRWVFGNRYLRAIAAIGTCCNFFLMFISAMFVPYAVRVHGLSAGTLGAIFSLGAIGGLVGSVLAERITKRFRLGRIYLTSMTCVFLSPSLIPLATGSTPVMLGMFIASFVLSYGGLTVANIVLMSLRQAVTPGSLMGRMNAAMRTLMFTGGALGGPCGGFLAGAVGLRGALTAAAVGSALTLLAVAASPMSRLNAVSEAGDQPPDTVTRAVVPRRRRTRWLAACAAFLACAVAGVAGYALHGALGAAHTEQGGVPGTALVTRTTLTGDHDVAATLGYGLPTSAVSQRDGTLTWLPDIGDRIPQGRAAYTVDNRPVVLLYGTLPLYRPLGVGSVGPDVRELKQNLQALGYAVKVDDRYTVATAAVVRAWQADLKLPPTGVLVPADVLVAAAEIRVTRHNVALGAVLRVGTAVLDFTTGTIPFVTIELDVRLRPLIAQGAPLVVELPDGRTTTGTVARISTTARRADAADEPGPQDTVEVIVTIPSRQSVGGYDESEVRVRISDPQRREVLTVPAAALVRLGGGRYAVRVVRNGQSEVVEVRVEAIAADLAEVSGGGLTAGMAVAVPR